jgi:hypothetical protein
MGRAGQLCPGSSDVDLPRYSESVVDLNAEITHGALDLSMAKQKLDGTHVAGSAINQRRLGSVASASRRISGLCAPTADPKKQAG